MNIATATAPSTRRTPLRLVRLGVLAVGPFATLHLLDRSAGDQLVREWPVLVLVTALAWSPLFFSVPALMLQRERDNYRRNARGLVANTVRALTMVPYLALADRSTVRLEMALSVLSWAAFMRINAADLAAGISILR